MISEELKTDEEGLKKQSLSKLASFENSMMALFSKMSDVFIQQTAADEMSKWWFKHNEAIKGGETLFRKFFGFLIGIASLKDRSILLFLDQNRSVCGISSRTRH